MSDGTPLRKRYFINGEPSPANEQHTKYLKPAMKLLDYVRGQMGDQLQQHLQRVTLEDGAHIEAHMRHGQAEIWIDIPRVGGKEEAEPRPEPLPYLWVGARVAWERMQDLITNYALGLHVFEPKLNGVASNYPIPRFEGTQPQLGTLREANPTPDAAPLAWTARTDADGTRRGIYTTRHGLYAAGMYMYPNMHGYPLYLYGDFTFPHDPEAAEDDWQRRPYDVPGAWGTPPKAPDGTWPLWDVVCVLDPYEGRIDPTDRRELLRLSDMARELDLPSGEGKIVSGDYVVKLASADGCNVVPLEVDLEVRVLKAPYTIRKRFEVTIPKGTSWPRPAFPYGHQWPSEWSSCPFESGNNPHAENWWQGAVLANPRGSIRRVEAYVPAHGFAPEGYDFDWECSDGAYPTDIYIGVTKPLVTPWYDNEDELAQTMAYCVMFWQSQYPWVPSPGQLEALLPAEFALIKNAALAVLTGDADGGLFYWDDKASVFIRKAHDGSLFDGTWAPPFEAATLALHKRFRGIVIGGETFLAEPGYGCPDA